MYEGRIRNCGLFRKVISAEDAAMLIKNGMIVGTSGFTPSGYPKAVPLALAKRVRDTGEKLRIGLFTGASVGDELDGELARNGIIGRRLPYQTNDCMRNSINQRDCDFIDMHLSHTPQYIRYGYLGNIDVAIIEAVAITESGHIIPSTSIGNSPCYVEKAEKVIVEINTSQPLELEGMADIYKPDNPPSRKPIPILKPNDRIGTPYIPCGADKIAAVVVTDIPDSVKPLAPVDETAKKISSNLIEFLVSEVKKGRLPKNLLPLQSGVGSVANAVLAGLLDSSFENLSCYSEVVQDSMLDLLDSGKALCASTTSITLSAQRMNEFKKNVGRYKGKLVLRPQEISNNPEVIRRLGVISINTAIEADIYGNVNSTHIMGQKMMNGIGGSGDFARNSFLSIFTSESTAKGGAISSIVPMVSHCDHSEHDVMVIITENGVADLRGTCPRERARRIIENCAHEDYKPLLREYLERAEKAKTGHTAHILKEAFDMHIRYMDTGTMSK